MAPRVSIVVMAYNEVETLRSTVEEIGEVLVRIAPESEIVIIDDGSEDGTGSLADALAAEDPRVRVVHHPRNGGLGAVYRTGFSIARGELLSFFPADGQFPASILEDFVPRMADEDLVLGYLPRRDGPAVSKLLSAVERILYRLLFGGFPRYQGVFMIRRALLEEYPLASEGRGWAVLMELILKVTRDRRRRVRSVPTAMRPRRAGRSKVNDLRTVLANTRQLIALRRHL